jgi:UDP-2-acetamido-2-deoxy-ribo-hexuluronate aminotransferase
MIPILDLKTEFSLLKDEITAALSSVMNSTTFIQGPFGTELEKRIAEYIGTSYACGVANGTDALLLALEALGISAGDEVITTPFTFFATAEVVARLGAKPVFVDIDPNSFNLNPELIEAAITPKTKAIMVVHLFGQPADMDLIMEIAKKHNLYVVEDACQAIGSSYKGTRVGAIGDVACFSFYPTKNLGGYGDGGMIVTNNQTLHHKIKGLANHGSYERYYHEYVGVNSRLDEIQAAILLVKLNHLEKWNEKRNEIANEYTKNLKHIVKTPDIKEERTHVFHQYSICTNNRDELAAFLKQKGIGTGIYYPFPLHLQPVFKYLGYKQGDFPFSECVSERILALPIYPTLTKEQQTYVIDTIKMKMGNTNGNS